MNFSGSPQKMVEQIENLLNALPRKANLKVDTHNLANDIIIKARLCGVNQLPRALPCTKNKADEELDKLIVLSKKLFQHIGTMHRTSLERFETTKDNLQAQSKRSPDCSGDRRLETEQKNGAAVFSREACTSSV